MDQPKSIEDLDKIVQQRQQESVSKPSTWPYVITSLIFSPLGLFLSWRAKILPFVLPTLLMINSVIFGYFTAQTFSTLSPVLLIVTEAYEKPAPIATPLMWVLVTVSRIVGVFGFVAGFYFKAKINKKIISDKLTPILLTTLILQYIIGFVNILFVNYSVYQSIESIYPLTN